MSDELNAEDKLGLDDSFSSFTVLRADDDISDVDEGGDKDDADANDTDATDESDSVTEEDSNFEFDLSKMPDEQKKIFEPILKKMQSAYTKKTQGLAELKKKAAVADVLLNRGGKSTDIIDDGATPKKEEFDAGTALTELKNLKFEANDYYAPFFKKIIDALETVVSTTKKEVGNVRKENTVSTIKTWFKNNPDALPFMAKMDEVAREHPTLYNDLDTLYTLASVKAGKGVPGKKKVSQNNEPRNKPKTRPTSLRNIIEVTGLTEREKSKPKINTIADAFKVAQEQLAG
jgi:hypothetical protein